MRKLSTFLILITLASLIGSPVLAQKFKLNAATSTAEFAPSNVGIIGLRYVHRPGSTSEVVEIYPGTPAATNGVRLGDRILAVDGISVNQYNANQVHQLMSGLPGTPVSLTMARCTTYCQQYKLNVNRMDMNQLASSKTFNVYKYGL